MIKKICLSLGLCLMALPSCSKFLDIQPVGKVIPNSLDEYRALLTKAYNIELLDRGIVELRGDIAQVRNVEYDLNSYTDIERWNDASPSQGTSSLGWLEYYEAIYYANAVISKEAEIQGATTGIRQLVGEAYMMRAYLHFILVNLYGQPYTKQGAPATKAIPIKTDLDLETVSPRNTVQEVYDQILSDLHEAESRLNVSTQPTAQSYRFSTLSVNALRSRVYLYMGRWTEARTAAEAVLAEKSTLVDLNAAGVPHPNAYNSAEMITAYERIYTASMGRAIRAVPSFVASFSVDDLRPAIYFGALDATNNYYPVIKMDGSTTYRGSLRTSEQYLNLAEAAQRSGDEATARTRLLQLLKVRYSTAGYPAKETAINALTGDALLTEILRERQKELAFEGHTWFDLRRTTRPALSKTLQGTNYTLNADDARYTLRIPAEAIESNPLLAN